MNAAVAQLPAAGSTRTADSFADDDFGVQRTGSADLPAADLQAVVLSRAVIEVLAGRRSPAQLTRHCAPEVTAGLIRRMPPGPLPLPHLLTVRVCEPADGAAEVALAYRQGGQVHAIAFRMAGLDGRWQITVVELVDG
ncbi:MAG: Rv3235 family protein [Nakamurella sp.]